MVLPRYSRLGGPIAFPRNGVTTLFTVPAGEEWCVQLYVICNTGPSAIDVALNVDGTGAGARIHGRRTILADAFVTFSSDDVWSAGQVVNIEEFSPSLLAGGTAVAFGYRNELEL